MIERAWRIVKSKCAQRTELPAVKEQDWLSAKELAGHFGLNEESAYRWRHEIIPEVHPVTGRRLIRYAGTARIFFHVDCVPFLEDKFASSHD